MEDEVFVVQIACATQRLRSQQAVESECRREEGVDQVVADM